MENKLLNRFRWISLIEGTSFLVLLFVGMPLKYLADMPMPNKVLGMAHGGLFILYVIVLFMVSADREWSFSRTLAGFVAAVLPFGPFVFDKKILKEELEQAEPGTAEAAG